MEVAQTGAKISADSAQQVTAEARSLVLIDDDDLSLAVLGLVAEGAGFTSESFSSGEAALAWLRAAVVKPQAVLTDMQMPGISGGALALGLREVAGRGTVLLAMSGSEVAAETARSFDGFLLKPFAAAALRLAYERAAGRVEAGWERAGGMPPSSEDAEWSGAACDPGKDLPGDRALDAALLEEGVLNSAVYQNFARAMPAGQVAGLYRMCLDDAEKRLVGMRQANVARDDAEYRRAAHAIKGGCGMVGALELAAMAAEMETRGLPALVMGVPDDTPHNLFMAASRRLGRMLELKASVPREINTAV